MKYLKNVISIFTFALVILVCFNGNSQSLRPSSFLSVEEFKQSAVIVQDYSKIRVNANNILTLEIINYNKSKKLSEAYVINGIEYCDNGKYNDNVAGDGIYTSVKELKVRSVSSTKKATTVSDDFRYPKELSRLNNSQRGGGISCKIRVVTCPETSWWNQCWFGSPCSCIEFYDCEVEINFE